MQQLYGVRFQTWIDFEHDILYVNPIQTFDLREYKVIEKCSELDTYSIDRGNTDSIAAFMVRFLECLNSHSLVGKVRYIGLPSIHLVGFPTISDGLLSTLWGCILGMAGLQNIYLSASETVHILERNDGLMQAGRQESCCCPFRTLCVCGQRQSLNLIRGRMLGVDDCLHTEHTLPVEVMEDLAEIIYRPTGEW